jgi:precorrin-6B methylase 2
MSSPGCFPSWAGPRGGVINPLPEQAAGSYEDDVVVVARAGPGVAPPERISVTTRHFVVGSTGGRLRLLHTLDPADLDDDLAGLLETELFDAGWVGGAGTFERLFTGIVVSAGSTPISGWESFYRNSLDVLTGIKAARPGGTLEAFAPVHRRAVREAGSGSLLDLGSCFGFLALQVVATQPQRRVIATDVSAGSMRLLAEIAARWRLNVTTVTSDAAIVPLPDQVVDTVTAIHLLEHVDAEHGSRIVAEAQRLARSRVVVAVPFEETANAAFGHVRTLDPTDLAELGRSAGWSWRVEDDHGGWLVLERPGERGRAN